jgi:penicillin amidase
VELPDNYAIALAWTALSPSTPFDAIWALDRAEDWQQFRDAARLFRVPPQNLLYADVLGNIGYQMPGMIPIRASGDGRFPVPGWTREFDWNGYIDFEDLPFTFNPPQQYIVTANNQVPPRDYPYLITTYWDYGFRAERITELIDSATGPIDIAYMQEMQADTRDPIAGVLVPLVLEALPAGVEPGSGEQARLLQPLLGAWNQDTDAESRAAALFEASWNHLLQNTFQDALPEAYWPEGSGRWMEIIRRIATDADSYWWDDHRTAGTVETRDDIIRVSFDEAIHELNDRLGSDPEKWTWGRLHRVTFRNGTLGECGIGPIENLFNRGPFPTGGGDSIITQPLRS